MDISSENWWVIDFLKKLFDLVKNRFLATHPEILIQQLELRNVLFSN
jgi:hypothetical protein